MCPRPQVHEQNKASLADLSQALVPGGRVGAHAGQGPGWPHQLWSRVKVPGLLECAWMEMVTGAPKYSGLNNPCQFCPMGSHKLPSSFLLVAPWCPRIRITWETSFQVVLTLLVPRSCVEKLLPQDMSFANRPELTRPHVGPERRAGAANLLFNRWGK